MAQASYVMPCDTGTAATAPPRVPERVHYYSAVEAVHGACARRLVRRLWECDPAADRLADWVAQTPGAIGHFERALREGIDAKAPEPLAEFIRAAERVPEWVDWEVIDRARLVLLRTGPLGGLVLGVKSLVYGYCAPAGNKPLVFSGRLQSKAARRLNETSRFVQAVVAPDGMRRSGDGFAITARVRLMHASVRRLLWRSGRWDTARWGEPINQHDMLATVFLFSSVLLMGLRQLGFQITRREADDYMHLWRYVGFVMGVDADLLPHDEVEAAYLQRLIFDMQGPPDDDSRALVWALFHAARHEATTPRELARAARQTDISVSLCRPMIGDGLADVLGLPPAPMPKLLPRLRRVIRALEATRRAVPGGTAWVAHRGSAYWDWIVGLGLGDEPARFEPLERLAFER